MLSEVSHALKITIVGGSIPERCGDRLYNTCCVFDSDGKLKAKHRKVVFLPAMWYVSIQNVPLLYGQNESDSLYAWKYVICIMAY